MLAVEARGLVKRFDETVAVDGIDLEIPVGGCFGFFGPNGAGQRARVLVLDRGAAPTSVLAITDLSGNTTELVDDATQPDWRR